MSLRVRAHSSEARPTRLQTVLCVGNVARIDVGAGSSEQGAYESVSHWLQRLDREKKATQLSLPNEASWQKYVNGTIDTLVQSSVYTHIFFLRRQDIAVYADDPLLVLKKDAQGSYTIYVRWTVANNKWEKVDPVRPVRPSEVTALSVLKLLVQQVRLPQADLLGVRAVLHHSDRPPKW